MLKLAEYHFGDDLTDGPEIADIKLGTGYNDLASDLIRLAKLYKKHPAQVASDPKNYLATDQEDAGRLAQEILRELGESKNQSQKTWQDLATRAWTLLQHVYGEVSAAGQWLYRRENGAERFPSLVAAGRSARGSRAAQANEEPEAPDQEGVG